jgi:hypothetical protein
MFGLQLIYSLAEEKRLALQAQIDACADDYAARLVAQDAERQAEIIDLIKMLRDHPAQISESIRQRCIKIVGEA